MDGGRVVAAIVWFGWVGMGPWPAIAVAVATWRSPDRLLRWHARAAAVVATVAFAVSVPALVAGVLLRLSDPWVGALWIGVGVLVVLVATSVAGAATALSGWPPPRTQPT